MAEDKLDEFLPDDQQEDIDDIEIEENWFSGPTLWSTDWTTETLVSQLRRGNINLDPRYQRRNAWDTKRKSLFIESLVLGLPIPQIILAEEKGKKGNFVVIDGKQRLLALRQFAVNQDERTGFKPLKLTGLKEREDLNGLSYDDIRNRLDLADDVNNFDNQTVRTVVIRGWSSEKYLYSVFLRINTGSVQLSTQELRQALHPGPFSDYIDDFSVESEPLKSALKLKQPDFRMRDTELVLRYFAYRNFLGHYKGNLKLFLDNATKDLNARWKNDSAQIQDQAKDLEKALDAIREIFGDRDQLRKWNGEKFEKRINRAVFDIMVFYFADEEIRNASIKKGDDVKSEFQRLCAEDRTFLSTIESTTKSIDANQARFSIWANSLTKILEFKITSPLG